MRLTSPAFAYGRRIPARFTCDGENVSPPLELKDIPEDTLSLALVVEDPDAPAGTWVHWVWFDLAPEGPIPEGGTATGVLGVNSWKRAAYDGPCPPSGIHRYVFRAYALSDTLRLPERSTAAVVRAAMSGKVLAEAVLMGRYGR